MTEDSKVTMVFANVPGDLVRGMEEAARWHHMSVVDWLSCLIEEGVHKCKVADRGGYRHGDSRFLRFGEN